MRMGAFSRYGLSAICKVFGGLNTTNTTHVRAAFCSGSFDDNEFPRMTFNDEVWEKQVLHSLKRASKMKYANGVASQRAGWSLMTSGKTLQAILCFENAIYDLKRKVGEDHISVLQAYRHLAIAYVDMDEPDIALHILGRVGPSLDRRLGYTNLSSIIACQHFVYAHVLNERYDLAIESQKEVIDRYVKFGPCGRMFLVEAWRYLDVLRWEWETKKVVSTPWS